MTSVRIVLAALLATTAVVPAALATATVQSPWKTGVMRTPEGKFAYCVSEARYDNNLWMILALNPQGEINLGIGQKGAQLPVGGSRTSSITVDGQAALQLPARVAKPELYVINVGDRPDLLQAIAAGRTLTVDGNSFELTGTTKAISTLRECVAASSGQVAPAPTAPVQSARPSGTALPSASEWVVGDAPATAAPATSAASSTDVASATPKIIFEEDNAALRLPAPTLAGETVLAHSSVLDGDASPTPVVNAPSVAAPTSDTDLAAAAAEAIAVLKDQAVTAPAPAALELAQATPLQQPALLVEPAPAVDTPAPVSTSPSVATTPTPEVQAVAAPVAPPIVAPLPAPLVDLLARAGLQDAKPSPAQPLAWETADVKGYVTEELAAPGSTLAELMGDKEDALRLACASGFSFTPGKVSTSARLQLATAQSRCASNPNKGYTTWVFSLTNTGVFSAIAHQPASDSTKAADRAQNSLLKVLKGTQG